MESLLLSLPSSPLRVSVSLLFSFTLFSKKISTLHVNYISIQKNLSFHQEVLFLESELPIDLRFGAPKNSLLIGFPFLTCIS